MPLTGDAAAMPPELNYYTLEAGDHAASLMAAAAAHQAMAAMLTGEATMLGANAATTAMSWEGMGGVGMVGSATEQASVMGLATAWFEQAAASLLQAAQTYQASFSGMIPGPVCDENRATWAALAASNILGQNTAAMAALDEMYFGQFWPTNASMMSMWQAAATAAASTMTIPAPINPVVSNPAGPAAGVAQAAANSGAQVGMKSATQSMDPSMMGEMVSPLMSQLTQIPQIAGQLPQMLSQLPQMASQFPQMATGMLGGQLANPSEALVPVAAPLALGGLGPLGSAATTAVPAGSSIGSVPAVTSSYTRPATSFSTPSAPKPPVGWDGMPQPVSGPSSTGGMYGAAPLAAAGQQDRESEQKNGRTVKVANRR